jgi:hypothetical protein
VKSKNSKTVSGRIKQSVALACLIFALSLPGYSQTQEPQKTGTKAISITPQKAPLPDKPIEAKLLDVSQVSGTAL